MPISVKKVKCVVFFFNTVYDLSQFGKVTCLMLRARGGTGAVEYFKRMDFF